MTTEDSSITTISLDFDQTVKEVMEYLYGLGHRKIGFLGGKEFLDDGTLFKDQRINAFCAFCAQHSLDCEKYIAEDRFSVSSGYEMMKKFIEADTVPTAVFAASDPLALGAVHALKEHGYKVPEDVSVVGFDNTNFTNYSDPPLTTVDAPVYAMGIHSVKMVYDMMRSAFTYPSKMLMPCSLVIRGSCASPKKEKKK